MNALDVIRERVGQPVRIVSGYRPPHYNRMIGGASDSRHMYGDAADISADIGPMALARLIWELQSGVSGHKAGSSEELGDYDIVWAGPPLQLSLGFSSKRVHVDVRPGDPVLYGYDELKGKSDAELIKILESRSKRRSKGVN